MRRILSRLDPEANGSGQCPVQEHHIDQPVTGSINKPAEKPVEEPVDGSVEKPIDEPVNESKFTLEVTVIPVRENNDMETPASAISKGLVRLSKAMKAMNSLSAVKDMSGETDAIASIVVNALNIMATVPTKIGQNASSPITSTPLELPLLAFSIL